MQKKINTLQAVDSMRRFSRTLTTVLADKRPVPKLAGSGGVATVTSSSSKSTAMRRRVMTERRRSRAKLHWKRVQKDIMSASVAFSVAGQERRNAYVGRPWSTIETMPYPTRPRTSSLGDSAKMTTLDIPEHIR